MANSTDTAARDPSAQAEGRREGRPDGWWYPYIFVGGFAVVVTVNMIMMYFATSTFTGLVVGNAYDRGLAYNTLIEQERAQDALGWAPAFSTEPLTAAEVAVLGFEDGTHPLRLQLVMTGPGGEMVDGLRVEAMLVRPTQAGHDHEVLLRPVGAGVYRAEVALPLAGQWDVQIFTVRGDDTYRLRERIFVR